MVQLGHCIHASSQARQKKQTQVITSSEVFAVKVMMRLPASAFSFNLESGILSPKEGDPQKEGSPPMKIVLVPFHWVGGYG